MIAVDIGNTNISIAVFAKRALVGRIEIPVALYSQNKLSKRILSLSKDTICIIASVNSKITAKVATDLKKVLNYSVKIAGKDIPVPIKNKYRDPSQVGTDRLINAYAAIALYSTPAVVIDLGTALTIDLVSGNNEYLGGCISPGIGLSLSSLHQFTCALPQVALKKPKALVGKSTQECMVNGCVFQAAALISYYIDKISVQTKQKLCVIITGTDAPIIKDFVPARVIYDPDLTLKGIAALYYGRKRA